MILRHAKGTVWLKVLIHRVVVFFTLEGQYEAWVFSYHMKDPTQAERQKTQAERKRERGREREGKKRIWRCIINNSYPRHCVWFRWEAQRKKLISFTDGNPIQGKCQKDSHDSQSTCEKEHSTENATDLQMVMCAGRR